jgi:hypothetical protein
MQGSRPRVPVLKNDEAKRTTIILEHKEREYIECLIKEGKEPSIKALISKMLDIYKSLNVDDWRFPGEYYCGISRIAFINVELLNILTNQIPKDKLREVGAQLGTTLKISMQSTLGLDASLKENWEAIFQRLRIQGLGEFQLKDKFLVLKSPVIAGCEIWQGILEGLLGIDLETRISLPPMVFEIKKH